MSPPPPAFLWHDPKTITAAHTFWISCDYWFKEVCHLKNEEIVKGRHQYFMPEIVADNPSKCLCCMKPKDHC